MGRRVLLSLALAIGLGACGAKTQLAVEDDERPDVDGGTDAGFDGGFDAAIPEDMDMSMPDEGVDLSIPEDMWTPECPDSVRVSTREASIPVDVIFVIDNSGSMLDDIDNMRSNMEIFWEGLVEADIDSHVIFVTQEGFAPFPPPSFSGRFFRLNERVNSHDGILKLLAQFSNYERYLRPDAITHFVGITDDDANRGDAEVFMETMPELLGHEFTFHAIASERIRPTLANPSGACVHAGGYAFSPGYEWNALAEETGGIQLSICEDDWAELLTPLTERVAVRIPIPCGYSLPTPPPAGVTYDADDFTVLYENEGDPLRVIPQDVGGTCASGGWTYFDASRRIELCPETCEELMALDGRIEIDLGCTVLP
tara:strand:- start:220 stop:1326 length:1107 start_codon:yes stop_codon:yes gene_type:complete